MEKLVRKVSEKTLEDRPFLEEYIFSSFGIYSKKLAKSCLWRGHVRQNNFYSLVTEKLISVFLQTGSNQIFTDQSMKYFSFYTVTGLGYRLGLPGKIQMKSHFYIVSNIKRIY